MSVDIETVTKAVLDALFQQGGGTECANILVRHQVESFNEFLDKKLVQVIEGFNPIQVCHNYSPEAKDFRYKMFLNVLRPSLTKPMYQMSDGAQMLMTPYMARLNNLTYACNLYVDIHIITEVINNDGVTERNENTVTGVCIGKLPIMVRSKACVLTQMPTVADADNHECRYDYGGYFIISGNEKVVVSQDRISENKTLVFAPNCNGDGLNAEIRSMPDLVFLPPKTTSLHMAGKPNHMGHVIRLNASFLRSEIPLFVMFRALGVESDREIYAHIVLDIDSKKNERIIAELAACAEDACDVHTQEDALNVIRSVLGTTGTPKEYLEQPGRTLDIIKNTIKNDFLSHVGPQFKKKALYIGYMVRKLISIHLGYQDYDNRDSYLHKRIDTPGILYANLFRQCYGKLIKDVRNLIVRELNLWRATPNIPLTLLTANNIHRFFKQTVIESGLRYALSTGNWGVKSIGSFQNIRQGVAQVLNRMSYLSMLSHLRRISTPMEKNGKLVQPRKLENTQYGMVCPAECFDPDTPILMWNGTIKLARDIIVGDYLIDDNGNSIRVRSTCSGSKTMYEIIPAKKNFMQYTVTDNHILTLKARNHARNPTGNNKKYTFRYFDINEMKYIKKSFDNKEGLEEFKSKIDDVIDITIEQYLSLPKTVQKNLYTFKSSGINWEYKEVAIDPYILGMWLGDGFSSGYGFATADKELLDKWIEWGKDNDATIKHGERYKYRLSSTINNTQHGIACNKTERAPLKKLLEVYDLVNNKHIPLEYLVNDRKTRLAVLAGIIDTDGNVRANGHEIRICQGEPNYKIIYDTEFLARSLGFSCHLNDGTCSYTVNGEKRQKPFKELRITGEYLYEIPTVLPRKKLNAFDNETSRKKCSSYLQSAFNLVKKDVQPFVGWQVEGTGRFLLGDMTASHNTPEGSPVGLVKNMAMSTHITNNTSSALIRDMLTELGVKLYGDAISDSLAFLKRMGSIDCVSVMINGDLVGYHEDPKQLYDTLKQLKLSGSIPPKIGIVWDIPKNLITMSTEAGRLCRPLYTVDGDKKLNIMKTVAARGMSTSPEFCLDDLVEAGYIEFMDTDEVDKAMVAMFPQNLGRGMKGTSLPPLYTHCEISPSLMCGVLAANIPFMDHNQSPRNCYQCLWVDEPVMLVSGATKKIKDIRIGDEVLCFDPKTGAISNSKVTAHILRPASKPMCRITTISGRSIIVSTDHKIMTDRGDDTEAIWEDARTFKKGVTRVAIYGVAPSQSDNKDTLIARLFGYYKARPSLGFDTLDDEKRYNDDAIYAGFPQGYRDIVFLTHMANMSLTGLQGVHETYMSGYMSGIHTLPDETALSFPYNRARHIAQTKKTEWERSKRSRLSRGSESWDEFTKLVGVRKDMLMVPIATIERLEMMEIADITVESDNHSFIGGDGFAVSNSAMGKQAVGLYVSNFNNRTDTMSHVLHYPQKPLTQTHLSKYTHTEKLPSGINAVVAIMTYTGFNQEDSVMINKSAIDRGLFTSTYYKSYRDQCNKNHSTGEEEIFMKPVVEGGVGSLPSGSMVADATAANFKGKPKPFNYDKLANDGFVPKNTYVDSSHILVGKVMPHKTHGTIQYRDTSLQMKGNDTGYVDMNYTGVNGDGYKFCKVRLRTPRKPTIGDKMASRHAQKGTIGMIYDDADMPFTKDGIRPDIIMNPNAVPSRMTIAQLMECVMGKAGCGIGACGDCTPFTSCTVESIADVLETSGFERYGNEIMYNGRTGEQIQTEIFIGPTYYQRLKHMVADKVHCLLGNTEVLTSKGWKMISEITMSDEIATLEGENTLVYSRPKEVLKFAYEGDMYHVSNDFIDLDVTMNHRMYVSYANIDNKIWREFGLVPAEDLVGKTVKYKSTAMFPGSAQANTSEHNVLFDAFDESLPEWVWSLNAKQAQTMLRNNYGDFIEFQVSQGLADDIMRLCIHAGWSSVIQKTYIRNKVSIRLFETPVNPVVNSKTGLSHGTDLENVYSYSGSVYCLRVPTEVFMVRRNGKAIWTGNSRSSNGPIVLLTRQPAEGRARNGGLRFGEMERDVLIGHGMGLFLKERMLDVSDNFRVFPCRKCGMISIANPEKNIYKCGSCKTAADTAQIRIPYAMSLLIRELESMSVGVRLCI
jgi:DNA-directed RNA polymerase beta subunit